MDWYGIGINLVSSCLAFTTAISLVNRSQGGRLVKIKLLAFIFIIPLLLFGPFPLCVRVSLIHSLPFVVVFPFPPLVPVSGVQPHRIQKDKKQKRNGRERERKKKKKEKGKGPKRKKKNEKESQETEDGQSMKKYRSFIPRYQDFPPQLHSFDVWIH